MDEASQVVTNFLEMIEACRGRCRELHKELIRNGASSAATFLVVTGHEVSRFGTPYSGCIAVGIHPITPKGREFECVIDIWWDEQKWLITTEFWIESERNQDLVKAFPERYAETLIDCSIEAEAALNDLATCVDVFKTFDR